jgi:Amt family ammonium transporter
MMMSFVAMGVICLQWVLVGYTWAFGPGNPVWGDFTYGGLKDVSNSEPYPVYGSTIPHLAFMNFQMMFAIITPALISGAIVERMKFSSYVLFILLWSTIVYDPLAHWMWSAYMVHHDDGTCELKKGWLGELGAIDFAGGAVIHISAGFAAPIASMFLGKREGYSAKHPNNPASVPFVLLGAGLLWFGWLGFNGGSAIAANGPAITAVTNTTIAGATAFLTWLLLDSVFESKPSSCGSATGAVVGLATVTPGSGFIVPGYAILFGLVGTLVAFGAVRLKKWFKFDDSLDVFCCHGLGGVVGILMTGLFATTSVNPGGPDGAFYGNGELFGWQLLSVVVSIGISVVGTSLILVVLKYTIGLRVESQFEQDGLDQDIHKEAAFDVELNIRSSPSVQSNGEMQSPRAAVEAEVDLPE